MQCPACTHSLMIVEFNRIEIDLCPACGGCWLDEDEIGLIVSGDFQLPAGLNLKSRSASGRRCPHCRLRLRTGPLPATRVRVDACPMRHGLWLDAGELRAVAEADAGTDATLALAHHLADVVSSTRATPTPEPGG